MQYCPDGTLQKYIDDWRDLRGDSVNFSGTRSTKRCEPGTLPVMKLTLIRLYTRQLLSALEYLHSGGSGPSVIHHDIKAGNILLANNGQRVCLADFGEALESDPDGSYPGINRGTLLGTAFHHAPEILKYNSLDGERYDVKVDVWALGCVVLQMITGDSPECVLLPDMFTVLPNAPNVTHLEPMQYVFLSSKAIKAGWNPDPLAKFDLQHIPEAVKFLGECFTIDPRSRKSAAQLLNDPFCKGSAIKALPVTTSG
jgi:mitogen-activated protein kinase kinase kinase